MSWFDDVDPLENGDLLVANMHNTENGVSNDRLYVYNRSTDEIGMRLGEDDDHSTLYEQHNSSYLQGPDGRPTMQELNEAGSHALDGSTNIDITIPTLTDRIATTAEGVPGGGVIATGLNRFGKVAPWVHPVWLSPDAFFLLSCGTLLGLGWAVGERFVHRERIRPRLLRLRPIR